MTEMRETNLPGIGTLHDFACESGARIGVISHHADRREVVVYDTADPDRVSEAVILTPDEARLLADLLGGTTIVERLEGLRHDIAGLALDWLPIPPHSPYAGRTIGDTEMRTRTGVSVVALVRDDRPIPAPGPEERLEADDTAVVVGTPEGIGIAAELLAGSAP